MADRAALLIIGAGGHGRVVADAVRLTGRWEKIAFIDDRYPELDYSAHWPVIGTISQMSGLVDVWGEVVVAVGDNTTRLKVLKKVKQGGFELATVIHPSAQIAEDVLIGEGTIIFANAVVNIGSQLGTACIVNSAATIDHDNRIGDGVHVSPGAHLAGDVAIGARSWVGIGASVVQGCTIGINVIVGAGAVVTKNIDDGLTVVGIPARELKK